MKGLSRLLSIVSVAILALSLSSCGSANPNDQGMAFTLIGFSDSGSEVNLVGVTAVLSTDTETEASAPGVLVAAVVQNNLVNQGIRTDRALISYYVEGASSQPPSTTQAFPGVLGPSVSDSGGDTGGGGSGSTSSTGGGGTTVTVDGSLPAGWENIENKFGAQFYVVPPDIMAWLNLNRNVLPELPFQMTCYVTITGVSTAGDRMETNSLPFRVTFKADQIITPESGGGSSTGTTSTGEGDGFPVDGEGDTGVEPDSTGEAEL